MREGRAGERGRGEGVGGRSQGVMYGLGVRVAGEEVSAWSECVSEAGTGSYQSRSREVRDRDQRRGRRGRAADMQLC